MTQDNSIPLLTERDLSVWLAISLPSLQRMRSNGTGPRFVQLSERRIAYRKSDVEAWLTERTTDRVGGSLPLKDAATHRREVGGV